MLTGAGCTYDSSEMQGGGDQDTPGYGGQATPAAPRGPSHGFSSDMLFMGLLFLPDVVMAIFDPPVGVTLAWLTVEVTADATLSAYSGDH